MKNMNYKNEDLVKKIIAEKDKIKLNYVQKLNDIKQHYGVEFDVEHYANNKIKNIIFLNLKYKSLSNNITISYNGDSGKFDYIDYEFSETRFVKGINHKRLIPNLNIQYKLKIIVAEINRINADYITKLNEIETVLKDLDKNINSKEKVLVNNKNEEDE